MRALLSSCRLGLIRVYRGRSRPGLVTPTIPTRLNAGAPYSGWAKVMGLEIHGFCYCCL